MKVKKDFSERDCCRSYQWCSKVQEGDEAEIHSSRKEITNRISELEETSEMFKPNLPLAQMVTNLSAMQETQVQSLGREDPLEKEMATHSNILAWRIQWTEEPGYSPWGRKESDTTERLTLFFPMLHLHQEAETRKDKGTGQRHPALSGGSQINSVSWVPA